MDDSDLEREADSLMLEAEQAISDLSEESNESDKLLDEFDNVLEDDAQLGNNLVLRVDSYYNMTEIALCAQHITNLTVDLDMDAWHMEGRSEGEQSRFKMGHQLLNDHMRTIYNKAFDECDIARRENLVNGIKNNKDNLANKTARNLYHGKGNSLFSSVTREKNISSQVVASIWNIFTPLGKHHFYNPEIKENTTQLEIASRCEAALNAVVLTPVMH